MAVEPEDEELLLDQQAPEESEPEDKKEEQPESEPEGEIEGYDVLFGDEAAPASGEGETGLVKHLREQIRERDKELSEFRKRVGPQTIEVGEEPTLSGCDYDEDRFKEEWRAWNQRKAQAAAQESQADQSARIAQEQWQRDVQSYQAKKAQLNFADVEEVEAIATAALSEVQQAVIVKAADNPALVLYSLGKHPAKLTELSQIADPLKLAAQVAKLEGGLKVMPRRRTIEPEQIASGTASITHGADKELERLEKEAARNGGDRSKVIAYKARMKSQTA